VTLTPSAKSVLAHLLDRVWGLLPITMLITLS